MGFLKAPNHIFSAHGLQVGGVYPSYVGQSITPQMVQEHFQHSSLFRLDFADRNDFLHYRKEMYNPEQSWTDPAQLLFSEAVIETCTLSTGRKFGNLPFQAYIAVYPLGFTTIIFWIKLETYDFQADEIIELTALAHGTSERINRKHQAKVCFRWNNQTHLLNNFLEICKLLENDFRKSVTSKSKHEKEQIQIAYPMIYVQEVIGCKTARDIVDKHKHTITGIANLWPRITSYLKDEEVALTIKNDVHPFVFGLNVISTCCHVELHPERDDAYLKKEGLSFEENLYEERIFLSLICEIPVIQFFILRTYDAELSTMHERIRPSKLSLVNPLYPINLVYNAIRLTKLQQELILAINYFRGIYLPRRAYIQRITDAHRAAFGTSKVEESIDRKLLVLQNNVSTTYSMLTTILVLLLSFLALLVGVIQGIAAVISLGWFH